MPVVATPVTPTVLRVDEVRRFMRDYPNNNILLDDVEFSQADVDQGFEMVVGQFNVLPPQTSFTVENFPANYKYLMLIGVTSYLMRSCAFLQLRNQATIQDGDVAPIGIDDKFPLYMQYAQTLSAEFNQLAQQVKIQNNIENAYGCVSSGYINTYRFNRV